MNTEMSVVLWSPSTLITLKLTSIMSCQRRLKFLVRWASVTMNVRVVAGSTFMAGEIIPLPLVMPAMVTTVPSLRVTLQAASFFTVSVVMMALAARSSASGPFPSAWTALGMPADILSMGRKREMTPVEATPTRVSRMPRVWAVRKTICLAS